MDEASRNSPSQPYHQHEREHHHFYASSPRMQYYPQQQQQQQHAAPEVYRASPTQHEQAAPHAVPQLPPIQHFDGQMMQQQYGTASQIPPPPPMQSHHAAPYQPQYPYGNEMPAGANGQNGVMMRFPIQPQPSMQAPGAKNKRDIKRRTKTGCLTCRKRRIKCDEARPTCRNCQKSKRECLGYDPTFIQQTGPPLLQPAPNASGVKPERSPRTSPHLSGPYQHSHPYPSIASSRTDSHTEYGSIDSILHRRSPPYSMASSRSSVLQPARKVQPITMDQLVCLNDVAPQYARREAPAPVSDITESEVNDFYRFHFASGLDRLFETTWYIERGFSYVQNDGSLLDFTMQVMEQMSQPTNDHTTNQNLQSLEAQLVWRLASMPRSPVPSQFTADDLLTTELLPRIDTLENLLTGQFLPVSQIPPPSTPEHKDDAPKYNQLCFWHRLGLFTSLHDDTDNPSSLREIADSLNIMRSVLNMLENRDVLYSLAIMRHIGGRLPDWRPPQQVREVRGEDGREDEEVRKLAVAHGFVASSEVKGTTQVVQRVCGMGLRGVLLGKRE